MKQRRRSLRNSMDRDGCWVVLLVLILVAIGSFLVVSIGFHATVGYAYDRDVENYFDLADRASDAPLKEKYFAQFLSALEKEGLDRGDSSAFFAQPNARLETNYEVARSLMARLNNLSKMSPASFEYQVGMEQVLKEFCWFPLGNFKQGYYLKHGGWLFTLTPPSVINRCSERRN